MSIDSARDALSEELRRIEATIDSYGGSKFQDSCAFISLICAQRNELLAACEAFVESFSDNGEFNVHTAELSVVELLTNARAAIQKARPQ